MSEMYRNILNNKGIGLIAAIFIITSMAMYGLLIARYMPTGTTSSTDDYQWVQALYSVEVAGKLRILFHDRGGSNWGGGWVDPIVQFQETELVTDTFTGRGLPATLTIKATHRSLNISREITIKYIL